MLNQRIAELKRKLKYRHLLGQMVVKNIKKKYKRSVLGVLWTILHPLLYMFVLTEVFAFLLGRAGASRLYILTGLLIFQFVSEATNHCLNSITGNRGLIEKVYVPKLLFPLSHVLSSLINLGFSLIALIVVVLALLFPISWTALMFFVMLPALVLFAAGIGFALAAMFVYFRDISHLYSVFMTLWMYASAIFYNLNDLSKDSVAPKIIKYNPLYRFIAYFRAVLIGEFKVVDGEIITIRAPYIPQFRELLILYGCGIISFIIGAFIFNRLKNKFLLYL